MRKLWSTLQANLIVLVCTTQPHSQGNQSSRQQINSEWRDFLITHNPNPTTVFMSPKMFSAIPNCQWKLGKNRNLKKTRNSVTSKRWRASGLRVIFLPFHGVGSSKILWQFFPYDWNCPFHQLRKSLLASLLLQNNNGKIRSIEGKTK